MRQVPNTSLWLGHAGDVRDVGALHSRGFRAVVCLAVNEPPLVVAREMACCRFPLVDGSGNESAMIRAALECVAALVSGNVQTLVYCSAGMSRTPCIGAGALSLVLRVSPQEAFARVTSGQPSDVSPALWASVEAVLAARSMVS